MIIDRPMIFGFVHGAELDPRLGHPLHHREADVRVRHLPTSRRWRISPASAARPLGWLVCRRGGTRTGAALTGFPCDEPLGRSLSDVVVVIAYLVRHLAPSSPRSCSLSFVLGLLLFVKRYLSYETILHTGSFISVSTSPGRARELPRSSSFLMMPSISSDSPCFSIITRISSWRISIDHRRPFGRRGRGTAPHLRDHRA